MSFFTKQTNKLKSKLDKKITAMNRSSQNKKLEAAAEKLDLQIQGSTSLKVVLVFLPGSDTSSEMFSRIKARLSGCFSYMFITSKDKALSFAELNTRILETKADYVIFINNAHDVSKDFDKALIHTLTQADGSGIAGAGSYYSDQSDDAHCNLIKQVGLFTQKNYEKDKRTPFMSVKEKGNKELNWPRNHTFAEEKIPSTDLLAISFKLFNSIHGFPLFYNTDFLTFPLADLCLLSIASGMKNYLCCSCFTAVTYKAEKDKTARVENRKIFRGRWLRYLSDTEHPSDKELNEKSIDICGPMPDNDNTKFWGDYHYSLAMKKSFEKQGYKVNILSREHWYDHTDSKYILVLRGNQPYYRSAVNDGRIVMFWAISHPADITTIEIAQADHVFFASAKMQELFKSQIFVKSSVLPQCTDQEVMFCDGSCALSPELLFVGNSRRVYRRILKDLLPTDHELKVFGRHWEEFPLVQEHVVSEYIDNAKVSSAYHNAAILLNDHWDDMLEYGIISNRIFDALCAGAFVISDDVSGIHELLGDAVVTYKDSEDLKKKIDYYLSHPDERNAIAAKGQAIVKDKHTFDARVAEIIEVIKKMSQT